jgi:hypothetical protein
MDEKKKVLVAGASFIVLVAVVATVYFVFFKKSTPDEIDIAQAIPAAVEQSEPEMTEPEATEMPEVFDVDLDESDALIRELVSGLSDRPELARWLLTEDMIRKFVAAVDNIANGDSPRKHLPFLQIPDKFSVLERDGELYMDPAGYQRYDTVSAVFSALPARESADLFRRLTPVFQEAYTSLGYPGGNFRTTLLQAIDELLGVPVMNEDVVLEEKLQSYGMADPRLEGLSQAQKHLFRMGPRNVGRIKAKLRELKGLL